MHTILVALDGSAFAEAAIPVALGMAQCLQAQIALVTVHPPPSDVRAIAGASVHALSLDGTGVGSAVVDPLHALFGNTLAYLTFEAVLPRHPMWRAMASQEEYDRDLNAQKAKVGGYLRATVSELADRGMQVSRCALADKVLRTADTPVRLCRTPPDAL